MKNSKHSIVAVDSVDLAKALGLRKEDAVTMEFRARLNKKIVELTAARRLTHAQLAQRTGASRTRITAILNGHTMGVSTDFLLRILCALGCKTIPTFAAIRPAA